MSKYFKEKSKKNILTLAKLNHTGGTSLKYTYTDRPEVKSVVKPPGKKIGRCSYPGMTEEEFRECWKKDEIEYQRKLYTFYDTYGQAGIGYENWVKYNNNVQSIEPSISPIDIPPPPQKNDSNGDNDELDNGDWGYCSYTTETPTSEPYYPYTTTEQYIPKRSAKTQFILDYCTSDSDGMNSSSCIRKAMLEYGENNQRGGNIYLEKYKKYRQKYNMLKNSKYS